MKAPPRLDHRPYQRGADAYHRSRQERVRRDEEAFARFRKQSSSGASDTGHDSAGIMMSVVGLLALGAAFLYAISQVGLPRF